MASTNLSAFLRRLTREMVAETLAAESDRQLVEQFLARRGEAVFETIVRRHGPMVYRVCWRVLRQEQDTEDAFQATFVILAQRLRTLRKRASLASWLHGVAHRVALKAKAEAAVRRRHEQQAAESSAGPPDEVTWGELRGLLDSELAGLPEKWRQPLVLCFLEGRTQDEAAKQLGWSDRTLRRRLDEAREALGRRLTRRGVVWPAALSALLVSNCVAPAAVPPALVGSTVEAASLFAAGQVVTTGLVSAKVAALTEGVTKAMFITKLKTATAALMLLAAFGLGSAVVLNQMLAAEPLVNANPARPAEAPVPKEPAKAPTALALADYLQSCTWTLEQVNVDDSTISISDKPLGSFTEIHVVKPRGGKLQEVIPKGGGVLQALTVAKDAKVFLNGRAAKLADLKPSMTLTLKMADGKALVTEIQAFAQPAAAQYLVEKVDLKKNTIIVKLGKSDDRTLELPLAKEAKVIVELYNVPGRNGPLITEDKMTEIAPGTHVRLQMGMEGDRLVVRSATYSQ